MPGLRLKHYLFVAGALVLLVLLYTADRKGPPRSVTEEQKEQMPAVSLSRYTDSLESALPAKTLAIATQLKKDFGNNPSQLFDTLAGLYILVSPALSAVYREKEATEKGTGAAWQQAGEWYYKASRFEKPAYRPALLEKAMASFKMVLRTDSMNLKAMTMLGACMVEEGKNPMEGISMLRNVVMKDSTYLEAHVQLGLFAIQSGQLDKAADRFKRILRINPSFNEAYIYLGQVYADQGKNKEAIEALQNFKKANTDSLINQQVEEFILELKNKI